METRDYRMLLVIRAVGQIRHMSGRSGNELIVNRTTFLHAGNPVAVPSVSSNCLRHSLREAGGMWLIDQYELSGLLKKEMLRLLVNGGNNATKAGGAESLSRFVAMRQSWPILGLMGCGLPDGPKPGTLKASDAVLLCNETREWIAAVAPELESPEWLRPARTCVTKWISYRHDPVGRLIGLLENAEEESDHSGMIFGGEAIIPGALLVSEIHLEDATVLEVGALLWSLRLWQARGGYLGGMSAKGAGRTQAMLLCGDIDADALADDYATYAISQREPALAWLRDAFEAKPAKEPKPEKKPRGKKQEASTV